MRQSSSVLICTKHVGCRGSERDLDIIRKLGLTKGYLDETANTDNVFRDIVEPFSYSRMPTAIYRVN